MRVLGQAAEKLLSSTKPPPAAEAGGVVEAGGVAEAGGAAGVVVPKESTVQELTQSSVSVGDEVVVLPGKVPGVVVVANKATVRVKLTDGPAKGEEVKKPYKQIRLKQQDLVAPAGAGGKKRDAADGSDDSAEKKLRGAEKALSIFGAAGAESVEDAL